MDESISKPVARGVVVYVEPQMNYGYVHASGYGRVLITHNFKLELMELGNWLSVAVKPNTGPFLVSNLL